MRHAACSTMAVTAGLMPYRIPAIAGTWPYAMYSHESTTSTASEGSTKSAPAAMHQPADIGRELLCFGTGKHHAVVERVKKASFGNPAPAFHQFVVHDRD